MHVRVLVVGGGPVGLALAGDLGWRGVECLLVERSDGRIVQPRMDMVGVRTMEFVRRWGFVDWVEASPYPRDYAQDYVYVTSLTGFEFEREPFPSLGDEQPPPQSPQKRERCPQDMFDPILMRFARAQPSVELRYETELRNIEQTDAGVTAELRNLRTGRAETITADYVVGCDGAKSTVRSALGIEMEGTPALTYTTNVIFRCPDLLDLHDKGVAYRFICIGPEGTYATLVAINGNDRWRLSIIGDGSRREVSEDDIHRTIHRVVGRAFDYEIESVMPWVRRELIANSYGTGRVFIAGDAAHVMSPTGGFGMNTGIGDAVDIAWKLDAVLAGWGAPGLLASYTRERRPVAVRNAREASRNLRRMLAPRENPPPPVAFEDSAEGAAARRDYGQRFRHSMANEWFGIGIHLGYRYTDSPVVVADPDEEPVDGDETVVTDYDQTSAPGARAPHVWLADGRSTLDLFGDGFVLLRLGSPAQPVDDLAAAAAERGVPLQVVDIDEAPVVNAYGRPLVLVRPDGHVAWRGYRQPADPAALVDTVCGSRILSPTGIEH